MLRHKPEAFDIRCDCGYNGLCEWKDEGIGSYEFWGAPGNDVRWVATCPACDEEVEE